MTRRERVECCFSPGRVLLVQVTSGCNHECLHCFRSAELGPRTTIDVDPWSRSLAKAVADTQPERIVISGGEPTLVRNLADLVMVAHQVVPQVGLCSNGWLVDSNLAYRLATSGLGRATIGLDGIRGDHDAIHQRAGAFEKALAAILAFHAADVAVTINVSATSLVSERVGMFADILHTLPIASVSVSAIVPHGRAANNAALTVDSRQHAERVGAMLRGLIDLPVELRLPDCEGAVCPSGRSVFTFAEDGSVTGCPDRAHPITLDLERHRSDPVRI